MEAKIALKDGFKPKLNYRRKQNSGTVGANGQGKRMFPWVNTPEGRVAKTLIGMLGEDFYTKDQMSIAREFAAQQVIFDRFTSLMPWFGDLYYSITGKGLTRKIVWDRLHKQYYTHTDDGGKPGYSPEHYSNDERLRPYADRVFTLKQKGMPITREQAIQAGS